MSKESYKFIRERIKEIDELRHLIIHQNGLDRVDMTKVDEKLDYMQETCDFLIDIVTDKYIELRLPKKNSSS